MSDKVFVAITNKQIYKEMGELKNEVCLLREQNEKQHRAIMDEISGYKSQTVNLKYAITGIGVLTMFLLGWFITHIST